MSGFARLSASICGHVYVVLVAHLLWAAGTFAGLIVLGAGPATAALPAALRAGTEESSARACAHAFWAHYRSGLWRIGASWVVLAAAGAVVVIATGMVGSLPLASSVFVRAALLSAAIIIVVTAVMWASAEDALDLPAPPLSAIRIVLLYAVARLPLTIVTLLGSVVVLIAVLQLPGTVIVLGPGAVLSLTMPLARRSRRWDQSARTTAAHAERA